MTTPTMPTAPPTSRAAAPATVSVAKLGKVFHPPGGTRELLRGRLFREPVRALEDVTFDVAPGEIVCMMGPNGAGKSTLARILGGLLLPSSGRATIAGHDAAASPPALRRSVSFIVGDERSFHYGVSGRENLRYFAALHGLDARGGARRADELLDRVGLAAAADRRYREYSRGMRQRLAIARGLLGSPSVLLLDEPTLGLDPVGARDLRAFLRDEMIRSAGRTAIVCSNDPTEARALADRVLFLERGRLVKEVAPTAIEAELGL
ncbi:MAG TPA: ABC transporter ATP-binding protein [Polyangia bacterium]|nr:ABC transporter ATP-binding protein [Polyangia bacterium]